MALASSARRNSDLQKENTGVASMFGPREERKHYEYRVEVAHPGMMVQIVARGDWWKDLEFESR